MTITVRPSISLSMAACDRSTWRGLSCGLVGHCAGRAFSGAHSASKALAAQDEGARTPCGSPARLHQPLVLGVQRGGGLVQDEDGRVLGRGEEGEEGGHQLSACRSLQPSSFAKLK